VFLFFEMPLLRASPAALSMYVICTVKLDEKKSKHADLAQESRFGSV
jgi:hypothetical protein